MEDTLPYEDALEHARELRGNGPRVLPKPEGIAPLLIDLVGPADGLAAPIVIERDCTHLSSSAWCSVASALFCGCLYHALQCLYNVYHHHHHFGFLGLADT